MTLLLIVLIVIAAAPYVIAPIRTYQRQRQPARPSFEPFDATKHPLPAGLADTIQRNVALLAQTGFGQVADLFRTDTTERLRAVVELVARFAGGRPLTVDNSPLPRVFGRVPGKEKVRLRDVRDPVRLFRIYQALVVRRYGVLRREPADYRADSGGFLGAAMARELGQQVDTGYVWLDDRAQVYRPTWKAPS